MGFVKSIEICNFKSYKDVHLFGPFDATKILSIIGENGEGKSNFTDAIAFVFGDKSGSLRARHLRDLCFGGIAQDASIPCYVKVVCSLDTGEEVVFERAIVNQGRNCQFSIGGEVMPQKTYSERLYELGIDGGAQNFIVQQGAVDKLGIMNPNQRTEFFEKLSSFVECALAKKDVKRFKAEAKARQQYDRETVTVKILNELIRLMELFDVRQKLNVCETAIEARKRDLEEQKKLFHEALQEERNKHIGLQFDRLLRRIQLNIDNLTRAKTSTEGKLNTMTSECAIREQRKELLEKKVATCREKKNRLGEARKQLKTSEKELKAKTKALEKVDGKFAEDLVMKYDQIQADLAINTVGKQIQELDTENTILDKAVERSTSRIAHLNTQLEEAKAKNEEIVAEMESKRRNVDQLGSNVESMEDEIGAVKKELKGVEAKKDELEALKIMYAEDSSSHDRHQARKGTKDVVKKLRTKFGGSHVYGRVYDLMKPVEQRYARTIDAALGERLNWILVSNDRTASECVAFLDEERMTPEVIVPLSRFKITSHGSLYISDEHQYHPLQGIALCDHAAEAQHLAASEADLKQAVTLDGFLFSKHSVSTFGKALKSSALIAWQGSSEEEGIPKRADWEEKMTKTDHKIAELKKQAEALATALAELKVMRDFESKSAAALASKFDGVQQNVTFFKEKLAEAHASHNLLVVDFAEKKHRIETMRADQAASSANLYTELIAEMGISHISEYESVRAEVDNVKKVVAELTASKQQLQSEIEFLRADLEEDEKSSQEAAENCRTLEAEIQRLKAGIAPEMERSRRITAALPKLEAELRAVKLEKAKESSQAKQEQTERREKMKQELAATVKEVNSLSREKDRLVLKREELLSKAAQEGMKLPLVRAEREEIDPRFDQRRRHTIGSCSSQPSPTEIDFSSLPRIFQKETEPAAREEQINREREKLDASKKRLRKVKVPEMDNTADLVAAEAKLANLEKLVKAIKKEIQEIESKFVTVREQRKRRFEEFFKCVNEHVLKLYRVVTADESAYAQLALEDLNEPFAGGIHYACILPSKAATMFEMMSSGEQTLASLALSLAIHATSKTPLLILDEIDAALDMHNTDRVYSFLRSTVTEGIQIFVISHRYEFLYRAEHALGLYANEDDDVEEGDGVRRSTKALSFDATGFEDNDVRTSFAENRGNQDWSQIQFDRDGSVSARSMGSLSSLSSLSSFNLNVRP
ncbi:hypothetical protein L596_024675 [Steinernema carpocapsae]|uniref:Structural maintenance of chromosomes protein n=1 Tax=Steinernema carpocapsae TaxID=34508 RepID=A0A4U5M5J6_STECR|nr:hypothetical protein L596_024675 [Steinernema carpocapsae]